MIKNISETFKIKYNNCDEYYIEDLVTYFNNNKNSILNFFNLKKLSKKMIINIYDNINDYSEYRNNNINDTSVGNIDFDDITYYLNILSYKEIVKRKGHYNDNLEYMYKLILHEFVHICHEEANLYNDSLIWVKEGIAIVLSKQYDGLQYNINNCTLNDLLNNKRTWNINYYTLMDYSLKKYGIEYIKKLVFDDYFARQETMKLYEEINKSFD